ncbi:hypothetical protein F4808DRAFT_447920 [Astrocystis sublimbata]|nr:hypothetical protein F4808DRAFT_447920 [Astrocystis sublimbata]
MSHHKRRVRTSRRVLPLADKDIDHEIALVDHDDAIDKPRTRPEAPQTRHSHDSIQSSRITDHSTLDQSLERPESQAPLTQNTDEDGDLDDREPEPGPSQTSRIYDPNGDADGDGDNGPSPAPAGASDIDVDDRAKRRRSSRPVIGSRGSDARPERPREPETEIDILYENQRGGFLCGIPLFSSAALGNLDPTAWTNFAHKPSPTDIHTAQVPDPSWQWAWPEWRINHDEQIQADSDGWEYSFMFSKKFSWHSPNWYSSYVRRRAWIRRRIKVGSGYSAMDESSMNPAYFTVSAAKERDPSPVVTVSEVTRLSVDTAGRRSQGDSRGSRSRDRSRGDVETTSTSQEARTTQDLLVMLKQARIDREKLEAVGNYIDNCTDDLLHLQDHMHEIMSMFVFQASRKTLLARLTRLHDDATSSASKGKSAMTAKAENLAKAIVHADEEVRRLEFWSDIKGMAESGEAPRAADEQKGWDSGWSGVDNSGAAGVNADDISR